MKALQSLTSLLLLFLFVLALASWDLWRREANVPAVDEATLRQ